jgi:hypothetical protein
VRENTDSKCTTAPSKPGDPFQSWRFEPLSLPTFFAAAKKVGAAPHRGNANRPLSQQGKATSKERPPNPKAHGNQKSHYLNPALTYWSFLKNRPTIHPKTHRRSEKPHRRSEKTTNLTAGNSDSKRKLETKPNHA